MKEIYDSGKTGWYYRVLTEGSFQAGDTVKMIDRFEHRMSILEANEAKREPSKYPERVAYLLGLDVLAEAWKKSLVRKENADKKRKEESQ